MSSGMSTFSVTNSQSKHSEQLDLICIALQTNLLQDSHEKALITEATPPIYQVKTSTTVSCMLMTDSKCINTQACLGTSAEVVPYPLHRKKIVCPVLRFSPEAITLGKASRSHPIMWQFDT